MLPDDSRLAALQSGAGAAGNAPYVTIRTDDLRWLLEQVIAARGNQSPPDAFDIPELN